MKLYSPSNTSTKFDYSFPLWLRWCSVITLLASIGFLSVSLFAYNYHTIFAANFVPALLVVLSFAIFLNIYSLWHLRKEYREADQAFRATDCEFSSIFQNVLDGILIVDNEGDCLDANPAAASILRISPSELIGQNVGRFVVDSAAFKEGWIAFLQNKSNRGRARLVAGDGTTLFVDFTAAADYLPGRHVLVICDVTERTRAELSLRKSEERFQQMANNIAEIFWTIDATTQQVTYVNPAYSIITGHSVESLQTNPSSYRELIHPEDRIRVLSRLQNVARSGILDEEFRFFRADGEVRWCWAKGSKGRHTRGAVQGHDLAQWPGVRLVVVAKDPNGLRRRPGQRGCGLGQGLGRANRRQPSAARHPPRPGLRQSRARTHQGHRHHGLCRRHPGRVLVPTESLHAGFTLHFWRKPWLRSQKSTFPAANRRRSWKSRT